MVVDLKSLSGTPFVIDEVRILLRMLTSLVLVEVVVHVLLLLSYGNTVLSKMLKKKRIHMKVNEKIEILTHYSWLKMRFMESIN